MGKMASFSERNFNPTQELPSIRKAFIRLMLFRLGLAGVAFYSDPGLCRTPPGGGGVAQRGGGVAQSSLKIVFFFGKGFSSGPPRGPCPQAASITAATSCQVRPLPFLHICLYDCCITFKSTPSKEHPFLVWRPHSCFVFESHSQQAQQA